MPELLDDYMQQIAPRCWNCPVLRAAVELEILCQREGEHDTEVMQRLLDRFRSEGPEATEVLAHVAGPVLGIRTDRELKASKMVSALIGGAEPCSGTKRGAPEVYPLRYRVVDFILNKRFCASPGLQEIHKY